MKRIVLVIFIVLLFGTLLSSLTHTIQIPGNKTVPVGVLLPLSGSATEHGEGVRLGMELAESLFQTNKFRLIYEDDACDPKTAISAYRRLVAQGAKIIVGPICSGVVLSLAPLANMDQIPVIATAASSPDISKAGEFVFRLYPSDKQDADAIVGFLSGDEKVALFSASNDYGFGLKKEISGLLGDRVVYSSEFASTEMDFRSELEKIAKLEIGVIVYVGYPKNTQAFLQQANELKVNKKIIGSSATFSSELVVGGLEYYFTGVNPPSTDEVGFSKAFKSKFGYNPVFLSDFGFDTYMVLTQALGSGLELKSALERVNFTGATGEIMFDRNGDRQGSTIGVYAYKDGVAVCVEFCDN